MRCSEVQRLLPYYTAGRLRAREHALVVEHLHACPRCRQALNARRAPRRRRSGLPTAAGSLLAVVFFVALGALIVALFGLPDLSPGAAPATADNRINVLLMGADQRGGETAPARTDSMMLLSLDSETGRASVLSIPRDLWVTIPNYGQERINAAHVIGEMREYEGGGPALAMETVAYNLDVPVDYYLKLNFEGFRSVVDAVGGIDIEVEKAIDDPRYPDENYGYDPLYIPAGLVHMDGDLALKYVRTRHGDSDFGRARRQQQVLRAVKEKVLELRLLPKLMPRIPALMKSLSKAIETDMPLLVQARVVARLATLDESELRMAVLDETMVQGWTTPAGAMVLLPIPERVEPLLDDLFRSSGASAAIP